MSASVDAAGALGPPTPVTSYSPDTVRARTAPGPAT